MGQSKRTAFEWNLSSLKLKKSSTNTDWLVIFQRSKTTSGLASFHLRSTLAVASSTTRILLCLRIARAKQTSCRWPTLKFEPASASCVCRPLGSSSTASFSWTWKFGQDRATDRKGGRRHESWGKIMTRNYFGARNVAVVALYMWKGSPLWHEVNWNIAKHDRVEFLCTSSSTPQSSWSWCSLNGSKFLRSDPLKSTGSWEEEWPNQLGRASFLARQHLKGQEAWQIARLTPQH